MGAALHVWLQGQVRATSNNNHSDPPLRASPAGCHQKTDKAKSTPCIKFYSYVMREGSEFSLLPDDSHRFVLVKATVASIAANAVPEPMAVPTLPKEAAAPPKPKGRAQLQRISTVPFEDPNKLAFDQTGGKAGGKKAGKKPKKETRHSKSTKQVRTEAHSH
jgi:hypothetical protein